MPRKSVSRMMEDAEALDEIEEGLQVKHQDDVVTGEERTQIRDLGMGIAPTKVTNEADKMVALHHVLDGRIVRVPKYMVPRMLTFRFPVDNEIAPEFHRKRVWSTRRPANMPVDDRQFMCLLSTQQTDEVKAAVELAGLRSLCRKPIKFRTKFEADEHFRIKHRRSFAAYERYLSSKYAQDAQDNMTRLITAVLAGRGASGLEE